MINKYGWMNVVAVILCTFYVIIDKDIPDKIMNLFFVAINLVFVWHLNYERFYGVKENQNTTSQEENSSQSQESGGI